MMSAAVRRALALGALAASLCAPSLARAEEDKSNAAPADPAPAPAAPHTEAPSPPPDPFSFADFSWLNGNSRQSEFPLDSKVFSGQVSVDVNYTNSFAEPKDHTIVGSTDSFRSNEVQVTDLSFGGDFHWNHVRARIMTQFGDYSTGTPRNDSSYSRGQWDLADAYRYIAEAYGGYHWDALNGINLDAGIFMSYVGLCSYYDYENWIYQMSYVSANTPWFFQGLRLQIFTSDKLKIEPWVINGWQSYGEFNEMPGFGLQILWRPTGWFSLLSNSYFGADVLGNPSQFRFHSDDSIQIKYYENNAGLLTRSAFSLTLDAGCQDGGGAACSGNNTNGEAFLGFMFYDRLWFGEHFALTVGGGAITNPGRYLVLLPPINGATATTGSPYFTQNPGDSFKAWDGSLTLNIMPTQNLTWVLEYIHRQSNVPYFAGSGGVTPPGGNNGNPAALVPGWQPDLVKSENRVQIALLVRI